MLATEKKGQSKIIHFYIFEIKSGSDHYTNQRFCIEDGNWMIELNQLSQTHSPREGQMRPSNIRKNLDF